MSYSLWSIFHCTCIFSVYLVIIKPYSNDRLLFRVWCHLFKSWITRLQWGLLAAVIWPLICCHHLARVQLALPSSSANLANGPKVIGDKFNNSSQEKLSNSTNKVGSRPCSLSAQHFHRWLHNISMYKCSTEGTSHVLTVVLSNTTFLHLNLHHSWVAGHFWTK